MKTKHIAELHAKIEAFSALVEHEQKVQHNLHCETSAIIGNDHTQINIGAHRRFVIDHFTGKIFDTEGHYYGTLDKMQEWSWGSYYPVKMNSHHTSILHHAPVFTRQGDGVHDFQLY